nr:glycosyltransferase [Paracoccus sp. S-4012]
MATYDGARWLPEQLASLAAQGGVEWRLVAGDDGSSDATPAILRAFAAAHLGRVELHDGPRAGVAAHFRMLMARAGEAKFAAFCDQDDVWDADKLSRAIRALAPVEGPALWAARVRYVDEARRPLGLSPGLRRPAGFGHALIQNIAPGNSMVLNRAALRLLQAADAEAGPVPIHDWWAYQLVTGAGGAVLFEDAPCLDYRQHDANAIGTPLGLRGLARRATRLVGGDYGRALAAGLKPIAASAHRLTPENRARLDALQAALAARSAARRMAFLRASGAYAQRPVANLALRAAALAGWG